MSQKIKILSKIYLRFISKTKYLTCLVYKTLISLQTSVKSYTQSC